MSECVNLSRCVVYDKAAKVAGAAGRCPLCADCLRVAARDIASLAHDYASLDAELVPGSSGGFGTRVSCGGGFEAAVPIDLHIDELQRDIRTTLVAWEAPVRAVARLAPCPPGGVRAGFAVNRAVRVLAVRVDVLAGLPAQPFSAGKDGVTAVARLRRLHGRARGAVGGGLAVVLDQPGECSGCGASALRQVEGSDWVSCQRCGRRWTFGEYRRYVGMILEAT